MNNINKTAKKIEIVLTCPFKSMLVLYTGYVKKSLSLLNCKVGYSSLPSKRKTIVLLKSPHVNKRFKEHFCSFTHKSTLFFEYDGKVEGFLKYILINKPKSISVKLIF